ncbi:flagellar hook-associated protein 1 FlgK [Homoserinimonas aerilata]|uniref:Flagellar hook-associated protein 1 n=1 Tax=Homoserinimonas aerilata TaxID=1162970 RepID=A0A542YEW4_9MICO|nr:flagellar hook-associated protein FlgK [Homoserinimonas aerilata]TQL46601.1 flagellar hook-associated protein 1 FlgK [Homoserinimonas aerilata]
MSTFSGLNTAYTALTAARLGLDVVGQNIANANTSGYTRQRITTSSIGGVANTGVLSNGIRVGQGVSTEGIARLGNIFLDAKVRTTTASAGYWGVQANAMASLEATLQEPGENGLSAQLQDFWAAWHDVSNRAGEPAAAGVLLEKAGVLASQIARGYTDAETQWSQLRQQADGMVAELNNAGVQLADLNKLIRSTQNAGGNVNEMLDKRADLATTIATLSGGVARENADGEYEVLIGGNPLVSGETFKPVKTSGSYLMRDGDPIHLEWAHRPGAIALSGGELGGALAMLAPSDGSQTGGAIAEAAESYNSLAQLLADKVNMVHRTGESKSGATNLDFFGFSAGMPAALGLSVVPTSVDGIASALPGAGGYNGSVADQLAQLGTARDGADSLWSSIVTGIGVASRTAAQQSGLADLAAGSAIGSQLSHSSVDLDEENVNMMSFQLAYQGAARVMTAVDEMLDTLINRTGLVGR